MGVLEIINSGHVRILRLNRPDKKNALSDELAWGIINAVGEAATDDDVWVIGITGTADSFCSGLDLTPSSDGGHSQMSSQNAYLDDIGWVGRFPLTLREECDKPIVAGLNGVAVGAGFSLAMAADIRLAAESVRLIAGYPRIGGSPDGGLSWTLSQAIGYEQAIRFLLENRTVGAQEALDPGAGRRGGLGRRIRRAVRRVLPDADEALADYRSPDETRRAAGDTPTGRRGALPLRTTEHQEGLHQRGRQGGDAGVHPEAKPRVQGQVRPGAARASTSLGHLYKLLEHFQVMTFSDEARLAKPSEAVFACTLEALGAAPEEVVFIGDSPVPDIAAPQRVGMRAALVGDRHEDGVTPDARIDSLDELFPTLEERRLVRA